MNKHMKSHATDCTGQIDNISLVFSGYCGEEIDFHMAQALQLQKADLMVQTKTSRNGYKRNYKYREEKYGGRVLVSLMPVKPNAAPLRMEFNPAKLGREMVVELVKDFSKEVLFGAFKGRLSEFYERATVTRFDVAFDLYDLAIGDAFFWCNENTGSQLFSSDGMRTETIVFNRTKLKKIVVYDKAREQKAKGFEVPTEIWTRVEVRKRSCGQLHSLKSTKNPLIGFYISSRVKPEDIGSDFWVLLNAACGPTTIQSVLAKLSYKRRFKAKAALMNNQLACWNSQKLWKTWPKTVIQSGLLDLM